MKNRLACLLLLTFALPSAGWSQSITFEQASAIFGKQKILKFRKYSLEMTDQSQLEMETLVRQIKVAPEMMRRNLLIIQVFSCEDELRVKPYIGAVRGQVIIDYLEKNAEMPRKKCLIQDNGKNPFDTECVAGSGANLYIRPDWLGRD
jgi:hypothetical protein